MSWMVFALLLSLWVLALASGAALGLWVHLLLVGAVAALLVAVAGAAGRRSRAL